MSRRGNGNGNGSGTQQGAIGYGQGPRWEDIPMVGRVLVHNSMGKAPALRERITPPDPALMDVLAGNVARDMSIVQQHEFI